MKNVPGFAIRLDTASCAYMGCSPPREKFGIVRNPLPENPKPLRLLSLIPHSLRAHFACCQMTDQGFRNHSRLPRLSLPFPSALYSCFSVSR